MKFSKRVAVICCSLLMLVGLSAPASASHIHRHSNIQATAINKRISNKQAKHQNKNIIIKSVKRHHRTLHNNWFRDGLNNGNLSARSWVSWHESNHRWNVLSYGGRCIGYFQLDPKYLGYVHGHVNLNHRHQVQVADNYAHVRYGNWIHAKSFWQTHHWY